LYLTDVTSLSWYCSCKRSQINSQAISRSCSLSNLI